LGWNSVFAGTARTVMAVGAHLGGSGHQLECGQSEVECGPGEEWEKP